MFQPAVKLAFVRRFCSPQKDWKVCVDVDPSEEGRTGGPRISKASRARQERMQRDALRVRDELNKLGVNIGQRRRWSAINDLPYIVGDADIVAYHCGKQQLIVAEVEGESSGQPEQKLYKAVGQIVRAASCKPPKGWKRSLVLVVHGEQIAAHLRRTSALEVLDVAALLMRDEGNKWLFGRRLSRS